MVLLSWKPSGPPQQQHHLQYKHIALILCPSHIFLYNIIREAEHIPCDSSSHLFTSVISASIDPICLLSSATSTGWSAAGSLDTCAHVQHIHYYMIPRLPPMAGNQSLRGYYPYGAHLARASQPKTSAFLTTYLKASEQARKCLIQTACSG